MGGYVAACYVDWNDLHSPQDMVVNLLERFRKLDRQEVLDFIEATLTDNKMPNRDILEDASKIFYLVGEIEHSNLLFNPQILHEPWANRYRVHPGSGRAAALWLCGYERFKTIYTHFDEPGFKPPGIAVKINNWQEFLKECVTNMVMSPDFIDIDTYYAFPTEATDICKTSNMDSVWEYTQMSPMMPWEFIRFSEGSEFLAYKRSWRRAAWALWVELQNEFVTIGDTEFKFDYAGKIINVDRLKRG